MAAHPFEIITEIGEGNFSALAGTNYVFPFELLPSSNVTMTVVHTRPQAQDFSLRCWFSVEPGGSSIVDRGPELAFWDPRRRAVSVHNLRSEGAPMVVNEESIVYNITALPGKYHLNILNLSNSQNRFYFEMNPPLSL